SEVREKDQKEGRSPMYDKTCRNLDPIEAKKRVDSGESFVVRMKVPENQKIVVNDLIRGDIEFDSNTVDDQVILKSDGFPTYHLAVVVDDHLMEISHVVRGQEWITSFPKHKVLYDYFGWEMPIFVHTPAVTNMNSGKKLSKRDGYTSVDWYRFIGYLPEAVFNFIALLGWSHPQEKEIFDWEEYVKVFDLKDLSAGSPKFDLVKLDWMSGQYFSALSDDDFIAKLFEWLEYCSTNEFKGATEYITTWTKNDYLQIKDFLMNLDDEKKKLFSEITKTRIKKFEDLLPLNSFFINEVEVNFDLLIKNRSKDEIMNHLNWFKDELENISEWNLGNLKKLEEKTVKRAGELSWKVGEVFHPIRVMISGSTISPPLFESMYILGKEQTTKSLKM
ncbi:MAG: glutamate--tRNA ligase, partial [bacterium]|nr:glutamate--tRNA ligase [bacterium]